MSKYLILDVDTLIQNSGEENVIRIVKAKDKRKALEKFFINEWNRGNGLFDYKRDRDHCDWSEHILPFDNEEKMMEVMLKSLQNKFGKSVGQELYNYYNFLWEFNERKNKEYMVYPSFEEDYKISNEAILGLFFDEIEEILNNEDRPIYTQIKIMPLNSLEVIE